MIHVENNFQDQQSKTMDENECPICFEPKANGHMACCRQRLCSDCFRNLQIRSCPFCRHHRLKMNLVGGEMVTNPPVANATILRIDITRDLILNRYQQFEQRLEQEEVERRQRERRVRERVFRNPILVKIKDSVRDVFLNHLPGMTIPQIILWGNVSRLIFMILIRERNSVRYKFPDDVALTFGPLLREKNINPSEFGVKDIAHMISLITERVVEVSPQDFERLCQFNVTLSQTIRGQRLYHI